MKNSEHYPRLIIIDTYSSDMHGDAVDYEGDKLRNNFTRVEYLIDSFKTEMALYETIANPYVFTDVTVLDK